MVGTFRILQPGSSVATSLNSVESSSREKHMAYLEIKQRKFRMKPIKYEQVRPFLYEDISLANSGIDPTGHKVEEKVNKYLQTKVSEMIDNARSFIKSGDNVDDRNFTIKEPMKVLIRLRVDYEGFPLINPQRFGAQFVGKVANPSEILLLTKKKKEGIKGSNDYDPFQQLFASGSEEEINSVKIEDLINKTLNENANLGLLREKDMAQVQKLVKSSL